MTNALNFSTNLPAVAQQIEAAIAKITRATSGAARQPIAAGGGAGVPQGRTVATGALRGGKAEVVRLNEELDRVAREYVAGVRAAATTGGKVPPASQLRQEFGRLQQAALVNLEKFSQDLNLAVSQNPNLKGLAAGVSADLAVSAKGIRESVTRMLAQIQTLVSSEFAAIGLASPAAGAFQLSADADKRAAAITKRIEEGRPPGRANVDRVAAIQQLTGLKSAEVPDLAPGTGPGPGLTIELAELRVALEATAVAERERATATRTATTAERDQTVEIYKQIEANALGRGQVRDPLGARQVGRFSIDAEGGAHLPFGEDEKLLPFDEAIRRRVEAQAAAAGQDQEMINALFGGNVPVVDVPKASETLIANRIAQAEAQLAQIRTRAVQEQARQIKSPDARDPQAQARIIADRERREQALSRSRTLQARRDARRNAELVTQLDQKRAREISRTVGGARLGGTFVEDERGGLFRRKGQGFERVAPKSETGRLVREQFEAQKQLVSQLRAIPSATTGRDSGLFAGPRGQFFTQLKDGSFALVNSAREQQRAAQLLQAAARSGGVGGGGGGGRGGRGGGGGGFLGGDPSDSFRQRLRGRLGAADFASSAATFIRFAAAGATFGALVRGVAEAKAAVLDYEDSIRDLEIALGGLGEESVEVSRKLDLDLQDAATRVGENPGAAADLAARGIRLFGSELRALGDEKGLDQLGADFADAASTLALITKTTLSDSAGNLGAIASAYDASFTRINDAIASSRQSFGAEAKEIGQGLASFAVVAKEAGFTLEAAANVIGLVSAQTDQSGRAIATRLSRAVSIIRSSAGRAGIERLNRTLTPDQVISVDASAARQLQEIGEIYNDLSESQQRQIQTTLGGAANSRELIPLLRSQALLATANKESIEGYNEAANEAARTLDNLIGVIKKISGETQALFVNLGQLGVFDVFGLMAVALKELLEAVNGVLLGFRGFFDLLGPVGDQLQRIAVLFLSAAAAAKAYAAATGTQVTLGGLAAGVGIVGRSRRRLDAAVAFSALGPGGAPRPAIEVAARGARGARIARGGLAGAAVLGAAGGDLARGLKQAASSAKAFAFTAKGAMTALAASVLFAVAAFDSFKDQRSALRAAGQLTAGGGTGTADFLNEASEIERVVKELQESGAGFAGSIVDGLSNGLQELTLRSSQLNIPDTVERLQAAAIRARNAAEEEHEILTQRSAGGRDGFFFDFQSDTGISDGLQQLSDRGATAARKIELLKDAIAQLDETTGEVIGQLNGLQQFRLSASAGNRLADRLSFEDLSSIEESDAVANLLQDRLREFLELTEGDFSDAARAIFTEEVLPEVQEQLPGVDPARVKEEFDKAIDHAVEQITFIEDVQLRIAQAVLAIAGLAEDAAESARRNAIITGVGGPAALVAVDAKIAILRDEYARALAGEDAVLAEGIAEQLDVARLERLEVLQTEVEDQAAFAESLLTSDDELGRVRIKIDSVRQRLRLEPPGGEDRRKLEAELNGLRQEEAKALQAITASTRLANLDPRDVRGQLTVEIDNLLDERALLTQGTQAFADNTAALKAKALELQKFDIDLREAQALASLDPRDVAGELRVAYEALQERLAAALAGTPEHAQLLREVAQKSLELQRFAIDLREAQALANVDPRDRAGELRVAYEALQDRLALALAGTPEHAELLREVAQNEQEQRNLAVELQNAQAEAGVSPGSNLQQAQVAFENARRNLSLQLEGTVEYYQALSALRSSQQALAEAEREAAFNAVLLGIDITDPVAVAQAEVERARAALEAARERGAAPDELDVLELNLRRAENSAEQSALTQRLSDLRTARELNRITHAEYIQFLEEERAQLLARGIHTRQQQEALDQIDLALQAANEALTGQFNIGDIDVPTPFEVRRALKAGLEGVDLVTNSQLSATGLASTASSAPISTVSNVTYIQIDGADFARVVGHLDKALGSQATNRTAPVLYANGRKF